MDTKICLKYPAAILIFFFLTFPARGWAVSFTDITGESGTGNPGHGAGAALVDVDGDGDLDLYVSNQNGDSTLYINNGLGTFERAALMASGGPPDEGRSEGSCFGDIDNDGDLDLFILNGGGNGSGGNRLLLNNGGRFTDVTRRAGVETTEHTRSAAFADVDNDGFLDLYLANSGIGAKNLLFRNNGDGTFSDITDKAGVGDRSWSWSAVFSDVNGDMYPDLYVVNGRYPTGEPNHLFINNGDGTFRDASSQSRTADGNWGVAASFADVDNDGDFDLFVSNFKGPNKLFLNDGSGTFTDVSEASGLADGDWGTGPAFGDVDNDGDLDLYEGNGRFANKLYLNDGTGVFTNAAGKYPELENKGVNTTGAVFGDIDGDGDLDLYVVNWGVSNRLYRNDINGDRFLKVVLQGSKSNHDAVGAKVVVSKDGKLVGVREVRTHEGFGSQGPLETHFGLPSAGSYRVDVTFPSGIKISRTVQNGRSITVFEEGSANGSR